MILNNKTFDCLKWADLVGIPALCALYTQLAALFGWPYGPEVSEAGVIICTFLGTVLGISNYQYKQKIPTTPAEVYDLDDVQPLQMETDETEIDEHEDGGVM